MSISQSQFLSRIRCSNPADAFRYIADDNFSSDAMKESLTFYLKAYLEEFSECNSLEEFISKDESTILYGSCPVIFLGSNDWALKRFEAVERLSSMLEIWDSRIDKVLERIGSENISVFLIPEKDTVLRLFRGEEPDNTSIALDLWCQSLKRSKGVTAHHLGP